MPQSKKDDFKVDVRRSAPQPSAVERQVQRVFGMEPNLQRGTLLPFAKNPKTGKPEFAAPQVLYDLARAFVAPGVVLSGQPEVVQEDEEFIILSDGTKVRKPKPEGMSRGGLMAKYGLR